MKRQTTYNVVIDEQQRLALIAILSTVDTSKLAGLEPDLITGGHPLEFWVGALTDMPAVEAEHPGITHGLCL